MKHSIRINRRTRDALALTPTRFDAEGRFAVADLESLHGALGSLEVEAPRLRALSLLDLSYRQMLSVVVRRDRGLGLRLQTRLKGRVGAEAMTCHLERYERVFNVSAGSSATSFRTLMELLCTRLHRDNSALGAMARMVDMEVLAIDSTHGALMVGLEACLRDEVALEPEYASLWEMLRGPAQSAPASLEGQLRWVAEQWAPWLDASLRRELLRSGDLLREAEKGARSGLPGPGEVKVPRLEGLGEDVEAYSPDRHWMPELVLIAKNAPVWLCQLSRSYGTSIRRLDDIPDEALARLADMGVTGLWLIGIWERSDASRRIKRACGQHGVDASAYSIVDYRVSAELGGDLACAELQRRAWRYGIRLAADMVPNHVGIDSKWVIEHPEHLLSLSESPFPSYRFGGEDLSPDERVGLYLEEHYLDQSDAAVVFKRVDKRTGELRYVYHGNDGTQMPWNDTAQLDYSRAETRAAVIETILQVARRFPIIRFDAAMTLVTQHIQRLWFPPPGQGGAIPSRSAHGLEPEELEAAIPVEFWRELVDRVAQENLDCLLLAEAFWMLEGYFVRSLGMHRVYNSAFMHMLRDEDNAKYRELLRRNLAFDPRLLQRYLNFMSNPDEESAVEQFGREDKYFGVAVMMATLPGLPMWGHGQFEGYREKYGMDFLEPRLDEGVDEDLWRRHEEIIVPLLRRRAIFSRAEAFRVFDMVDDAGGVLEDVFAYSNRYEGQASLVLYHNRYAHVSGKVRLSMPARIDGELMVEPLCEALGLPAAEFISFRDAVSGLSYLRERRVLALDGLSLLHGLSAYECRVLMDFQGLDDADGYWRVLAERLGGAPVSDLMRARDVVAWGAELEALSVAAPMADAPALLALDKGVSADELFLWDPVMTSRQLTTELLGMLRVMSRLEPWTAPGVLALWLREAEQTQALGWQGDGDEAFLDPESYGRLVETLRCWTADQPLADALVRAGDASSCRVRELRLWTEG